MDIEYTDQECDECNDGSLAIVQDRYEGNLCEQHHYEAVCQDIADREVKARKEDA